MHHLLAHSALEQGRLAEQHREVSLTLLAFSYQEKSQHLSNSPSIKHTQQSTMPELLQFKTKQLFNLMSYDTKHSQLQSIHSIHKKPLGHSWLCSLFNQAGERVATLKLLMQTWRKRT